MAGLSGLVGRYALGLLLVILVSLAAELGVPIPFQWGRRVRLVIYQGFFMPPAGFFALYVVLVALSAGLARELVAPLLIDLALGYALYYAGVSMAPGLMGLLGLLTVLYILKGRGLSWIASTVIRGYVVLSAFAGLVCILYMLGAAPQSLAARSSLILHAAWAPASWIALLALLAGAAYRAGRLARHGGSSATPSSGVSVGWRDVAAPAAAGVTLVLLLHSPGFNPGSLPVSVDTFYYAHFLAAADAYGFANAVKLYPGYARPLFLYMLYLAHRFIGDYTILLDVVYPCIMCVLLPAAGLYAAYRIYGDADTARLAAWFTAIGPWMACFIASGFHANWLAIPLALLMLAVESTAARLLLGLLTVFTHIWTFAMYAAADVFHQLAVGRSLRRAAWRLAEYAVPMLLAFSVLAYFEGGSSSLAAASMPARSLAHTPFPINVFRGVMLWSWGSLLNPLIFLAAAVPLSCCSVLDTIQCWMLLLLIPYSPVIAERVILDTPLPLLAAVTLRRLTGKGLIDAGDWSFIMIAGAYTVTVLAALTPLHGWPWCGIALVRGACG